MLGSGQFIERDKGAVPGFMFRGLYLVFGIRPVPQQDMVRINLELLGFESMADLKGDFQTFSLFRINLFFYALAVAACGQNHRTCSQYDDGDGAGAKNSFGTGCFHGGCRAEETARAGMGKILANAVRGLFTLQPGFVEAGILLIVELAEFLN